MFSILFIVIVAMLIGMQGHLKADTRNMNLVKFRFDLRWFLL